MSQIDSAVGHNIAFETELLAQYFTEQCGRSTARLAVDPVICAHDRRRLCMFYDILKSRKIGFIKVFFETSASKLWRNASGPLCTA